MKEHVYAQNNILSDTLHGDSYLMNLEVTEREAANCGKYGILRENYLKEYKPCKY